MKIKKYINTIIHGDSIEVMKKFPSNSIDLVVTSPPYDNIRDYKGYTFDFENIAKQLYRIIKEGGVLVWVVSDQTIKGTESLTSFKQSLYFKEIVGFNMHDTMIYAKPGFRFPCVDKYHQTFEYMFVFCKGKIKTFNPIMDRKIKKNNVGIMATFRRKNGNLYKRRMTTERRYYGARFNVWNITSSFLSSSCDRIAYKHPAIFPEKLAEDHILSWSNKNDIVLDPMCGSGTTCKMAMLNGRKFIGIDCSKEYCILSRERIRLHTIPKINKNWYNDKSKNVILNKVKSLMEVNKNAMYKN